MLPLVHPTPDGETVTVYKDAVGWGWSCSCGRSGRTTLGHGVATKLAREHSRAPIHRRWRDVYLPKVGSEERKRFNRTAIHLYLAARRLTGT